MASSVFSENGDAHHLQRHRQVFGEPAGQHQRGESGEIAHRNDGAEAGILGRRAARAAVQRLIDFGAMPARPGASSTSTEPKILPTSCLHQAAHAHRLQIVLGGQFQAGLEAGDLRLVGQFVHLAAGDQRLEDRPHFAVQNGGERRAVGEVRQFGLHELHAGRLQDREGRLEGRARRRFGPLGEIDRRVPHAQILHGTRVLRRVVEALAGRTGVPGIARRRWLAGSGRSLRRCARRGRACPASRKAPWRRGGSPVRRWGASAVTPQ